MEALNLQSALQSITNEGLKVVPHKEFFTPGRVRCPFCKSLHPIRQAELDVTLRGALISLPKRGRKGRPPKGQEKPPFQVVKIELSESLDKVYFSIEMNLKCTEARRGAFMSPDFK